MTVTTFDPVPTYPSEGWLFDEDRALRDLMKGMVVTDQENNARPVEAWFGHPDLELREQKYPYVTVDLLLIQEGKDRVHRGDLFLADPPAWWNLAPLTGNQIGYLMEMPTPIDLDYQVATWSRNPRHDRQLIQQIMTGGRIPARAGLLWTADGKDRRLDLLSHYKRDHVDENGKRLFNNIFRVRVSSEVPWFAIDGPPPLNETFAAGMVQSIHMDQYDSPDDDLYGIVPDGSYVITRGIVLAVNIYDRTADVDIEGEVATGVPVTTRLPYLSVDQPVAVGMAPTVASPAGLSDYHLVVIGLSK